MPRRRTTPKPSKRTGALPINMKPVSLRFTQPQMADLRREAAETGLAMTEIIRRAVDFYLDRKRSAA